MTATASKPAGSTTAQGGEKKEPIANLRTVFKGEPRNIRRQRSGDGWCIPDHVHAYFSGSVSAGVVTNVTFQHDAPPMTCIAGYESTGQAKGGISEFDGDGRQELDPKVYVRTAEIVYDREKRIFKYRSNGTKIDSCDALLLLKDGTSIAGWKKK